MLERCHDNKREACRVLGISYHTLQAYLRYPVHDPPSAGECWQDIVDAPVTIADSTVVGQLAVAEQGRPFLDPP